MSRSKKSAFTGVAILVSASASLQGTELIPSAHLFLLGISVILGGVGLAYLIEAMNRAERME